MTADKAEKLVNELIDKGDIERDESKDLKDRIIKRGEDARKELNLLNTAFTTAEKTFKYVTCKTTRRFYGQGAGSR